MKNRTTVIFILVMVLLFVFNIVTLSALMVLRGDLKERGVTASKSSWGYSESVIDRKFETTFSRISEVGAWNSELSNRLREVTEYLGIEKRLTKRD